MEPILHKSFKKQFKKLPIKIQEQFFIRVNLLQDDKFHPMLNNHSVDAVFPGCQSINITGDYRAIFYEKGDNVVFVKIGTHSELYG